MIIPSNKEVEFPDIKGDAMELNMEVDVNKASMFELTVLRSPNKEEFTRILFLKDRGFHQGRPYEIPRPSDFRYQHQSIVSIESSYSSLHSDVQTRAPETASFLLSPDENLKLRVFIDKSVVEVFVNGKQALAVRVYPSRKDALGVSVRSQGQTSELKLLEAWQMKSIYEDNVTP